MPYGDEEIISARVAAQKAQANSISSTVIINGAAYRFSEREFPLGFAMVVPECFDTLAPELARRKYPYEDRPRIIVSNEDTTVGLAFDIGIPAQESLEARAAAYRSLVKHLYPSYVFFDQSLYDLTDENKAACFDYLSHGLDSDIYNLCFIAEFREGELMGWFNCPFGYREVWENLARQMIMTIKLLPQGGEGG